MQQAQAQLRSQLYQQAHDEMARINKIYTGQNYSLNNLVFFDGDVAPQPQYKAAQAPQMMNAMAVSASPPLTVSNEITMTALVQVASNRQRANPQKANNVTAP